MSRTDWLSAVAMLISGLVVGYMVIYTMSRRKSLRLQADLSRRDLEARRDQLIAALRDDSIQEAERARLEGEAADVLRQLDAQPAAAVKSERQAVPATAPNAAFRGFAWGVGSTAALAALLFFVMQSSKDRAPGGAVTGNLPSEVAPAVATDAELRSLEASVQKSPDDLALRNQLAKAYLDRENLMAVFEQTQFVLQRNPSDPQALTFGAIVRMAMGQGNEAMKMLQVAIQGDPTLIEAWVSMAWLHTAENRDADAAAAIAEAVKRHPHERQRLEEVLRQMRAQRTTEMAGRNSPAAAPPAGGPGQTPAAGGGSIQVTIDLGGSAPAPGAILFVFARAEGVASGPPIAAKRIPVTSFPITVEISGADSMMGQALPARLRIEARLDSDGVPTTRDPKDPSGFQDGVSLGASAKLVLR